MSVREDMTLNEFYGIDENTPDEIVNKLLSYVFKTELIYITNKEELLKIYNTKEKYEHFLGIVSVLIKEEPIFLSFLTDAIDDILYVINYGRYNYDISSDNIKIRNELISYLNTLKSNSTDELKKEYFMEQSECRCCKFKNNQEMLISIAYDSTVVGLLHLNETDSLDEELFLASTCYMLCDFEELYQYDSSYIDKSLDVMRKIRKKSNILTKIKVKSIEHELTNFNKND